MFFTPPLRTLPSHIRMADRDEMRPAVHIPMVYEEVAAMPVAWEYHVLAIDTRERALPDAAQLNELGHEGWIMTGMLDERIAGKGTFVYYYFVRQSTSK